MSAEAIRLAAWMNEACRHQMTLGDFEAAGRELRRLAAIESAARNLVKVKGRYHTEQAFKALAATLENPHG